MPAMSRISTGVGKNEAVTRKGVVEPFDLQHAGIIRARHTDMNIYKFKLYFVELKDGWLTWYTTQRPPDRTVKPADFRHNIDLTYFRVADGPEDTKKQWSFSLMPTAQAPHESPDYHFVVATEDSLQIWKDFLTAASTRAKFPANQVVAAATPNLDVDPEDSLSRMGFLHVKAKGTDWRSWNLRWVVLDGDTLSWSKPPKLGKDDVKIKGRLNLEGAEIHAGRATTPAQHFFRVREQAAEGESAVEVLFVGESRKDTVEWVNLLQIVSGNTPQIGAAEAVAVDVQDDPTADVGRQTQLLRTAKAVTRSTCVHYRRENKKIWQLKFIMLRNNQLHWFDPPDPDTKKISSEDAVILTEPFAVQGAPQHAPPGHCISIVTLTDRYLFIGLTPAETDEWRRLLQLIWHCARIDAGEQTGIDPQQLDAAVSQCAQEQVHQEPPLQCMQWRAGRGKKGSKESAWELVVVSVQGSEMQLSEPAGPGAEGGGAVKAAFTIEGHTKVAEISEGMHGFTLTVRGEANTFAVFSEAQAATWVGHIRALVASAPPVSPTFDSAMANAVQTGQPADGQTTGKWTNPAVVGGDLDELDDLDGLEELDIAPTEEQLDDLAELDELEDLDGPKEKKEKPREILVGPLEMKGSGKLGKWQLRYFCLDTKELKHEDEDGKNKGAFPMDSVKSISMMEGQKAGSIVAFTLLLPEKQKLNLRAKTEKEAGMWIEALNSVLDG